MKYVKIYEGEAKNDTDMVNLLEGLKLDIKKFKQSGAREDHINSLKAIEKVLDHEIKYFKGA